MARYDDGESLEVDAEPSLSSTDDDSSTTDDDSDDSDTEGQGYTVINMGGQSVKLLPGGNIQTVVDSPFVRNIQIGPGHCTIIGGSRRRKHHTDSPKMERRHRKLTESTSPPSNSDLNYVCNHIGRDWRHLARALGLSRGQIEGIEMDFHIEGNYEVAWQCLRMWKMRNGPGATLGELAEALDSIGCRDIALALHE